MPAPGLDPDRTAEINAINIEFEFWHNLEMSELNRLDGTGLDESQVPGTAEGCRDLDPVRDEHKPFA